MTVFVNCWVTRPVFEFRPMAQTVYSVRDVLPWRVGSVDCSLGIVAECVVPGVKPRIGKFREHRVGVHAQKDNLSKVRQHAISHVITGNICKNM